LKRLDQLNTIVARGFGQGKKDHHDEDDNIDGISSASSAEKDKFAEFQNTITKLETKALKVEKKVANFERNLKPHPVSMKVIH
jgi:hypothetical protein